MFAVPSLKVAYVILFICTTFSLLLVCRITFLYERCAYPVANRKVLYVGSVPHAPFEVQFNNFGSRFFKLVQ